MTPEDINSIVTAVLEAQQPKKTERLINLINSVISAIVVALLIYAANVFSNMNERVERSEKRFENMVDLNVYQSMMIDYNFDVLNKSHNEKLNKIYVPEMLFTRGSRDVEKK